MKDQEIRDELISNSLGLFASEFSLCFGGIYSIVKRSGSGVVYYSVVDQSKSFADTIEDSLFNISSILRQILAKVNIDQKILSEKKVSFQELDNKDSKNKCS